MNGDSVNQNELLFQKITSFLNTLFNYDYITIQNSFYINICFTERKITKTIFRPSRSNLIFSRFYQIDTDALRELVQNDG